MDKSQESIQAINHDIEIHNRNFIKICGVKKIESFNKEEFFLQGVMGYMLIKGENLELLKLDSVGGNISIKGVINSVIYLDENKKRKESMISKLFK